MISEVSTERLSKEAIFNMYLSHLKNIKGQKESSMMRPKNYIRKIEGVMRKGLLEAIRSSEVEQAIIKASQSRKVTFNGGHIDDGKSIKFRMGIFCAQYYRWAYSEGIIERNVYSKNTFPRPPIREAKYLDDGQIKLLLHTENLTLLEETLLRFMLDTGMRRTEICRARIKAVNINQNFIHIPCSKNESFRTVPFTRRTAERLKYYLEHRRHSSPYLFCTLQGKPFTMGVIGNKFATISSKVKFRVSAHMIRHTTGMLWARAGIDSLTIMRLLGHVDTRVTAQYVHAQIDHLKKLQDKVAEDNIKLFSGKKDLFLDTEV